MQSLRFFYQNPPKIIKSYNRKKNINADKLIIKGAKGSGKKTFVFDYLNSLKIYSLNQILYINESDFRFDESIYENLNEFLKNNQIKVLIINEINNQKIDILENLPFLDGLEKIFLLSSNSNFHLKNYDELWLDFLDFEEYLSSSNKYLSPSQAFSSFILTGRMLKENSQDFLQDYLKINFTPTQIIFLQEISKHIGHQTSLLSVFSNIKQKHKISKQSVFDINLNLENQYFIKWVKKDDKNLKKPYFTNFAIKNEFCIKKDFLKLFENIVFCELLKFQTEIFYTNHFHFYLPNFGWGIVCEPFLDIDFMALKLKKIKQNSKNLNIKQIFFITNNVRANFDNVVALPFYEWALGL